MGPPGAGKGTQASTVAEKFKVPHVSSGDMFRQEQENQTPLGQRIRQYLESGGLVPDDVTIEAVMARLQKEDCQSGFVLDGFPRTLPQAEALGARLREAHLELDAVVYLDVPEEVIVERMAGRRICQKCGAPYHLKHMPSKRPGRCDRCDGDLYLRDDDEPETVRARLRTYLDRTAGLIDYYDRQGLLKRIPGTGSPAEVRHIVLAALRHAARAR